MCNALKDHVSKVEDNLQKGAFCHLCSNISPFEPLSSVNVNFDSSIFTNPNRLSPKDFFVPTFHLSVNRLSNNRARV